MAQTRAATFNCVISASIGRPLTHIVNNRLCKFNTFNSLPRNHTICPSQSSTAVVPQASSHPAPPALDDNYESACEFADYANWLIPDKIMLGRYPYVEPSRCRSRDQGEQQLEAILKAGITAFVSLQAELPDQKEMRVGGVDGFLPYKATASLIAAALSDPPSLEECNELRTRELNKFLPPRRRSASPETQARKVISLDFAHFPITDLGIPSEAELNTIVNDLETRLNNRQSVYVHCWGGRGRAGTVGAALLAKMYGMSAQEALERVQRAFDTRQDGGRKSPETNEQVAFVTQYIEKMK